MKKSLYIIFCIISLHASGQYNFSSAKLRQIFDILPKNCISNIEQQNGICVCAINGTNVNIRANFVENKICHLGLKIFEKDEEKIYPSDVFDFVERFLLEYIIEDRNTVKKKAKEEKVTVLINNADIGNANPKMILDIIGNMVEKEYYHDSLSYSIFLSDSVNNICISFPANNNLIRGMDKAELDKDIEVSLSNYSFKDTLPVQTIMNQDFEQFGDLFLLKGNTYSKSITSNTYYQSINGIPIIDKRYPVESLANMCILGVINPTKKLLITHYQYGDNLVHYTLNFKDFISFFNQKKHLLYFGAENSNGNSLKATLVLYNSYENFVNIVYFDVTTEALFDEKSDLNIKLYTNIPSDNIMNLYGVFLENQK